MGSVPEEHYFSDAPLRHPDEDALGRRRFAEGIAQAMARRSNRDSLVVGISGAWGEGKTSVLNFVSHFLRQKKGVSVLWFNPWRFPHEEELLRGFFLDLARVSGVSIETLRDKLSRWFSVPVRVIAAVAGRPELGASLLLVLRTSALDEFRARLETALRLSKRRIVVLIDDVDRLDKDEVCAVFRLVKLTASLTNVSYVMAFDSQMVSALLVERYGGDSERHGSAFIEKIVQVPLHLPTCAPSDLDELISGDIKRALYAGGIDLAEEQWQEFALRFSGTLEQSIRTPRQSKAYANALMFALPMLRGEVNPVDLMLLQGIRVFHPAVYGAIHANRDLFLRSGLAVASTDGTELDDRTKAAVSEACEGLTADEQRSILKLLRALFPRLDAVYGGTHYGPDWGEIWTRDKRVASSDYFSRFFSLGISEADVSDAEIDELVRQSSSADSERLEARMAGLITSRNSGVAIRKLRSRVAELGETAISTLIFTVAAVGERLPDPPRFFDPLTPAARGAILVSELLQRVGDPQRRFDICARVLGSKAPLPFALECLQWLEVNEEEIPDPKAFSKDEHSELGGILARRIETEVAASGEPVFVAFPIDTRHLLAVWSAFGKTGRAAQHIRVTLEPEPVLAVRFLRCYLPQVVSEDDPVVREGDFRREQYDSVSRVVDPRVVAEALEACFGEELLAEVEKPHDWSSSPSDLAVAAQFIRIHRHVESGDNDQGNSDHDRLATSVCTRRASLNARG